MCETPSSKDALPLNWVVRGQAIVEEEEEEEPKNAKEARRRRNYGATQVRRMENNMARAEVQLEKEMDAREKLVA